MTTSPDTIAHEILDIVPVIMRLIRIEMRSQRSADLTVPQFRALRFIYRNPGASLQAVAHYLGLTSPTVCRMVDGLVLNHLVIREQSPKDRRKITLTLTAQGQEILEQAKNATQARLVEILAHLTPEESDTVMRAIKLLHPLFLPGTNQLPGKLL